jgi:hypothetical protein
MSPSDITTKISRLIPLTAPKAQVVMIPVVYLAKNPVMTMRAVEKMIVILKIVKKRIVLMIRCMIWIVGMYLMYRHSVVT